MKFKEKYITNLIKFQKKVSMIKILHPGFFNTIQDKGRIGFSEFGVPISGAMDSFSADLLVNCKKR